MPRILIVTGEASGDLQGANLAHAIRALRPDVEILGMGGEKMKAAPIGMIFGIDGLDVIGLPRVSQLRAALRAYRNLARFLRRTPLDAVVFIDSPGFNLRMARIAARSGHRVIYYIAPQVWAWHPGRMQAIARYVHRMLVILPFEEELFRKAGIPCDFVGHPILDSMQPAYDPSEIRKQLGIQGSGPVLGLLPGSRTREVKSLLPLMLQAAARLSDKHEGLRLVLAQAAWIPDELIQAPIAGSGLDVCTLKDHPNEVIAACDLLFVASGTATLQAAIIGTPMVILYRLPWLSYALAMRLLRIPSVGLVNIVAGRRIVPELIQREATPERLLHEAERLLVERDAREQMRADLRAVRLLVGGPGASQRAAALVLAECQASGSGQQVARHS